MTNPYASFMPPARRAAAAAEPESTWWEWRGHRVHVARRRRPESHARVLILHGAGGYSGVLWPIAAQLAAEGLDVAAVDFPPYGHTTSPDPSAVRYDDWIALACDLVVAEDDGRPLILLGVSIGGMAAWEVAARSGRAAAVVATCLMDPRAWRTRAKMTRFGLLGALSSPLVALAQRRWASAMVPIRWVAALSKMSRNEELSRLCASDPRGGGAKVPLGFLASYLYYRHTPPEAQDTPILLAHPSRDAWTPIRLSMWAFERLAAPGRVIMLRECGHVPVEEPGLTELISAVAEAPDLRLNH